MFTGLSRFIIHLFISITNLLYIYSLLFIFLLVYIIYYLSLFLEEKNNQLRKLVITILSNYKNQLFLKNNRRHYMTNKCMKMFRFKFKNYGGVKNGK